MNTLVRSIVWSSWLWLTKPSKTIQDEDTRRRIQLFSGVQFVMVLALIPPAFKILPIDSQYISTPFPAQLFAQAIAYGLSRTRYYRAGILISLVSLWAMALVAAIQLPYFSPESMALSFMWLILPMLYGSMIFSRRQTAIMAVLVFLGLVLFAVIVPKVNFIDVAPVTFFIGMWSVAHILLLRRNELVEFDRRTKLRESAQNLAQINQTLLQEIQERELAETQLAASLAEKEVLLKEIHHRVKNNLQIISSMLNLQSSQTANVQTLAVFQDSQHRIRSMALIHEALYRSGDLAQIDFLDYALTLVDFLRQSYRSPGVQMRVEGVPVFLEINTAVPCGLILNELISNALKHGFPNGRSGEVVVHLQQHESGEISLGVRDNGVGMPPNLDMNQTHSLGLQLVDTLVKQVNGRLQMQNRNGVAFILTLGINTL